MKVKRYIKKLKNKNSDKITSRKVPLVKSKSGEKARNKKKIAVKKATARTGRAETADSAEKTGEGETGALSEAMNRVTIATRTRARQIKVSPTLEKSKKLLRDAVKKSKLLRAKVSAKIVPKTRSMRSVSAAVGLATPPASEPLEGTAADALLPDDGAAAEEETPSLSGSETAEQSSREKISRLTAADRRRPLRRRANRKTTTTKPGLPAEQVSMGTIRKAKRT